MSSTESLDVQPGPNSRTVRTEDGELLEVPKGWELLPPGDATLTKRVKSDGPSWTVRVRGRKGRMMSKGVWADGARIRALRDALEAERRTPEYRAQLNAGRQRRRRAQVEYVGEFERAVVAHLRFARRYADLAKRLGHAIAAHATPVGSGTVARTQRIPIEKRAAHAVTAWLRHQTTAYDHMRIERTKGRRREVRRELAREGNKLLETYRRGDDVTGECPLERALAATSQEGGGTKPVRFKRARATAPNGD